MALAFPRWVIRWRWLIVIATVLIVAIAASGARFIEFSGSYRVFFSAENPQLQAFDELQNTYSKNDTVMFVLAPKDGKVFTRETLASVEWLTEQGWQMPYSRRVDSVTNFQHTRAENDDLVVKNLAENAASLTDTDLERIKNIALTEPLLLNRLISARAHVTGVNVTFVLPEKSLNEIPEVMAFARKLVAQAKEKNPDIDVYLTGVAPFNSAFQESSEKDLKTLVPLMYLVIALITFFSLRSVTGTIATLLVIIFSVITAMGMMGWLGIKLTAPSASAPTVILTLAIADSIHFLSTMFFNMRQGMDKYTAIKESLHINMTAIFLTSLTTVIGFLSMNFSEVPPFRDLGNVVAIGVIAAWLFSILFLPAFMAILPVKVKPARKHSNLAMERFANFVVRRRTALLWGMAGLAIGLVAFIPRNEMNDNFVEYFDESVDFRQATDFMIDNLTGVDNIEYSLGSGISGGINNPEYLQKLDEFAQWYRQQPGVVHVNTIADVMRRLNKNMHGDDPAWYRIPESRELSAQYLLLYEMSLPFGLDLNDQINVDKSATRFSVTLGHSTTKEILALEERAQQWLKANAPATMINHGTGQTVMFAYIGDRNIRSMIGGNLMALVLVSAIIMIAVRSFKIGLISLIPNLIPIGMAFGLWGLMVGQVGLSLSVVTALTFGIVVDDTIHFLTKYLHARREKGLGSEEAVRYAFATVGTAMWVTSLILVAGFSVLAFSSFELNAGMGQLAAITIAFALLADYLLLPPLLMKLRGKNP
jgi:predicted RND superfamily exporter protein